MGFLNAATNASLLGVLFVGGKLISQGKMTAGDLTKFALRSAFCGLGFSGLSRFYSDIKSGLDAASRIFDEIDAGKEVIESINSAKEVTDVSTTARMEENITIPNLSSSSIKGRLVFQNISFSYKNSLDHTATNDNSKPILDKFSAIVEPGSFVAITGESGRGKSTLFKLATGLFQPTEGKITLDGVDIHDDKEIVQSKLFYILQNSIFISSL